MLSNAVPRDSVLLAKWIGGYLVLVIPFLIAAFGGLGYAWWHGSLQLSSDHLKRLALLLLVACLYISVFFTLTLFISTTTHRSATALFVCLLIWVVWILAIPNLAPVVAKIASPAPSVEKINAEKHAVDREISLRMERLRLTSGELSYGKKMQQEWERLEQEGQRRKRRWDSFLADATQRQTDLAQTLGRISPAVCWTYSATSLMDTGPAGYGQFKDARKRLMKDLHDFGRQLRQKREKEGTSLFTIDEVPSLQVARMSFATAAGNALNDILILLIVNVVFFLAAFVFFLRYDVR